MTASSVTAEFVTDDVNGCVDGLLPVLQAGFRVQVETGVSIKDLLCQQFDVSPAYVDDRIRTAFLNGKPVDDFEKAIIEDGDTLALSAAMPGLVGATFRRGGYLASFRTTITHQQKNSSGKVSTGVVSIKLFNLLAREIGACFFKQGILVQMDDARRFLTQQTDAFRKHCKQVRVDGRDVSVDQLLAVAAKSPENFLKILPVATV